MKKILPAILLAVLYLALVGLLGAATLDLAAMVLYIGAACGGFINGVIVTVYAFNLAKERG